MTIPPLYGARLWLALAAIAFLAVAALTVPSCIAKHRAQAAQARVNAAQGQAAVESGKDASEVQATLNRNEMAGEALGRDNERSIRNAQGANAVVAAPARDAGIASLCRRAIYRDNPRCRVQQPR